ncbi:PREDICTED: nucleolar complex protein 4 homolog [Myotis brandtii]|uniref:nucleolar complex protein 4 homolog n=1 Tax=Myotis brandtii TaxID=109478 RepID=UPI0007042059|nr:PREDICTED: nucleolar complex protein 4 homolog [Myotis brandtii]
MAGSQGATRKYKVWMRHRYQSCCNRLAELLAHPSFQVKELALSTLMKFVQLEGAHPLEKPKWEGSYLFPRQLFKAVVDGLLSLEEDCSLLLSQFSQYLEQDDVRYHAMQAAADTVARVANSQPHEPSPPCPLPRRAVGQVEGHSSEGEMLRRAGVSLGTGPSWGAASGSRCGTWGEGSRLFPGLDSPWVTQRTPGARRPQAGWKPFPHAQEHRKAFQLMWLGFLKHKLPLSLYKKVLVIMHESILPHLAQPSLMIDFLTRAYDIGGAISLLALNGLFILIHEHNLEYPDFYRKLYGLLDPSVFHVKYRARFFHLADLFLSSSLPVGAAGAPHYHPEVSKAASVINQALSVPEASIAPLLELTAFEIFERDLKKKGPEAVPLEFIPAQGLLGRRDDLCAQHFTLS